jgi:hypothetical protein
MGKTLIRIIFALSLAVSFVSCIPFSTFQSDWPYDSASLADLEPERRDILLTAKKYLGVKYLKGGSSPEGFDCSGFVSYVFRERGIALPRSAKSQYNYGKKVSDDNVMPGDLLFFNINGSSISHVAIYVGRDRFIHAPSKGKKVSYASMEDEYWKRAYVGCATYIE